MHFIQRKQFSEANVTSDAFQPTGDMKIFPKCFHGLLIALWRTAYDPRACSWTTPD